MSPVVIETDLRQDLLDEVTEGASAFNKVIDAINDHRRREGDIEIPVVAPGEYRDRAEDWLTPERVTTIGTVLPSDRWYAPRVLDPRPNCPLTHEDVVVSWISAGRRAGRGLVDPNQCKRVLEQWPANLLSGYDPELEDELPLAAFPTDVDLEHAGSVPDQLARFETVKAIHPRIGVATPLDGAILAHRINMPAGPQGTSVLGIDLPPHDGRVLRATTYHSGNADLVQVDVTAIHGPARWLVR